MKQVDVYISELEGEEKFFKSKKECEDYENSLKDFVTLKFIVSRITPDNNKYVNMGVISKITRIDSSESFEVTKDLKITQYYTTYDNWDGRPPSNSITTFTLNKYLNIYSRKVSKFKDSLSDVKKDLINLKSIKYKNEKLDSLIDDLKLEIKNIEESVVFLSKYIVEEEE